MVYLPANKMYSTASLNMRKVFSLVAIALCGFSIKAQLQSSEDINGRTGSRFVQSAVPFLTIAPDARAGALADAGVATSPDINAIYWNAAKLPFIKDENGELQDYGVSLSYTPWLRQLINDMSLNYLSAYKRLRKEEVVGISLNYFNLGQMTFRDQFNNITNEGRPFELAFTGTYSRKLSEALAISVGLKWIHSNLASGAVLSNGTIARAGNSVAGDIGAYWNKDVTIQGEALNVALGANISNLGSKITYTTPEEADFIPTNLRLGTAVTKEIDLYNKITFILDFNKLLVPTPPIYLANSEGTQDSIDADGNRVTFDGGPDPTERGFIGGVFGSFADAPGGISEELQEFTASIALEYWYANAFAARAGYFFEAESKGNRKFITLGAGVKWQQFNVDFAYLVSLQQANPLANTIRISLGANFKSKKIDGDVGRSVGEE